MQSNDYGGGELGGLFSNRDPALEAALARIFVVRCAHTFEFAAATELLHGELEGREAVVVLDSLGTFHFRDKHTEAGAFC